MHGLVASGVTDVHDGWQGFSIARLVYEIPTNGIYSYMGHGGRGATLCFELTIRHLYSLWSISRLPVSACRGCHAQGLRCC